MSKKIMLVDDMEISNVILKKMLHITSADVHVIAFTDPMNAFDNISSSMPDLIFLDLNMPWLNGWSFLTKMKEHNYNNKVIVLTSSISILDEERATEFSNVIDYCIKPLRKDKLLSYIKNLIEEVIC